MPVPSIEFNSFPLQLKLCAYIKQNCNFEVNILSDKLLLSYVPHQSNTYVLKSGSKQLSLITSSKPSNEDKAYQIYLSNPNAQWSNIELTVKPNIKSMNKLFLLADESSNLNMISIYWKSNPIDDEWWLMSDDETCISKLCLVRSEKMNYFNLLLTVGLSRDTLLLILTSSCKLLELILVS